MKNMFIEIPICLGEAILDKFEESDPNKVLEINSNNRSKLTVEQARIQTISIARNLTAINVKKGDVVVIYSKPNEKITPITFACLTIGAAVHFLDTNLQKSVISERVRILNPKLIIYELEFIQKLTKALERQWPKNLKHVLCLDSQILHHILEDEESFQLPDIGDPKDNVATLMITTTPNELPKIKVNKLSHAMLFRQLYNFRDLSAESKIFFPNQHQFMDQVFVLLMLPVFFPVQRIYSQNTIDDENASKQILELIETFRISHYFDVSLNFGEILKTVEQSKESTSLTSLKIVYTFWGFLTKSLEEKLANIASNCKVIRLSFNSDEIIKKPSRILRKSLNKLC